MLTGWVFGAGSLFFLSYFIFKSTWHDYIYYSFTINSIIEQIPPWKHHTLLAFLRSISDLHGQESIFKAWFFSSVPLIALCSYTWYVSRKSNEYLPRLFGIAAITIIVCSPHLHHYDAIIAALYAFTWFSNKDKYYFKFSYPIIGVSLLFAYLMQQISILYIQKGISLVSIPVALCLLVDCFDLISQNLSKPLEQNGD